MDKISAVQLIRESFPKDGLSEIKALTPEDRVQLGSAIAADRGLSPDQLAFVPISY